MTRDAPRWLADFQARFGDAIRTPLDRSRGTLTAKASSYDARIVGDARGGRTGDGGDRLAVYNRQYWFRLFDVLQSAFPLTARLVGYWSFNDYASRFLLACPPRRAGDIEESTERFDAFFADAVSEDAACDRRVALVEGARIDAAWRAVLRAPEARAFRPSAADATRLLDARLAPSPAVAWIEEHYPLLELRRRVLAEPGEAKVEVPPELVRPRFSALFRKEEGIAHVFLEEREAELFALLRSLPVRDALAELERACPPDERLRLPAKAHGWLARSVELGFWKGMV